MPVPMEGSARTRLVALVVLVAIAVPLVIVAVAGGGGDDEHEPSGLRVERSTELPELIVYIEAGQNTPERSGGRTTVTVECVAADGRVVASRDEPWPFSDTDQGTLDPHTHMAVGPARIGEVESCRVKGTEPLLGGPVS
jgi:hypothetical protein